MQALLKIFFFLFFFFFLYKKKKKKKPKKKQKKTKKNHSTQDSHVVPHHGTNWAALWLTAQIRRDAVLSESYGRGYYSHSTLVYIPTLSTLFCYSTCYLQQIVSIYACRFNK